MSRISPSPRLPRFLLSARPSVPFLSHRHFVPLFFHCRPRISVPAKEVEANKKSSVPMRNWWQRALGQRLNSAGVASFASVVAREPHLALPHIAVPDIRWIDWAELERLGFRGVVFDKDNTLTAPYSLSLWPPLSHSLHLCRSAFPGKIAVFSNSAGLRQFDPDGLEARGLEDSIGGIHVIRHEIKKPGGTVKDIENYFGCSASLLVMVGDRRFTDVVYGNRHGFLTILTEPLSLSAEPFIVKQSLNFWSQLNPLNSLIFLTDSRILKWERGLGHPSEVRRKGLDLSKSVVRKLENLLVSRWCKQGLKPAKHGLLSEANQCIKVPSYEKCL